jgi:tmRNA-binding protein
LAVNKRANFDYALTDKYESGLVLTGARGKIGQSQRLDILR